MIFLFLICFIKNQQKEPLTLLKGGIIYTPKEIGRKDILFGNKILQIKENIDSFDRDIVKVIDVTGKIGTFFFFLIIVIPSFIDPHVL
jgi:dihydroorotase-like cyclic amidohydrolase